MNQNQPKQTGGTCSASDTLDRLFTVAATKAASEARLGIGTSALTSTYP